MNNKSKVYNECSGLLLIDKPPKWTSHDVVAKIRNHFNFKKVGHAGTLDPMATGLLILLIGKATKLSNRFSNQSKIYEGSILLGKKTSSQDIWGTVIHECNVNKISIDEVLKVFDSFTGKIHQILMVSAIKKMVFLYINLQEKALKLKEVREKLKFLK